MTEFINLKKHFLKHGPYVGATSRQDYWNMANRVLSAPDTMKLPGKKEAIKFVDPRTGEIVVYSPNIDKILTYYIRKNVLG